MSGTLSLHRCVKGGKDWRLGAGICSDLYGVSSMKQSAERLQQQICSQPEGDTVVVMGHNGPIGLGKLRHNICGVDWRAGEGLLPAIANACSCHRVHHGKGVI